MQLKQHQLYSALHQAIDILLVAAAFFLAFHVKKVYLPFGLHGLVEDARYDMVFLITLVVYHLCFRMYGCYENPGGRNLKEIVANTVKVCVTGTIASVFFVYIFHLQDISRLLMGIFSAFSMVFLVVSKGGIYLVLSRRRKSAFNVKNILVIGSRIRAIEFLRKVREADSEYRVVGCLDTVDQGSAVGREVYGEVKILGTLASYHLLLSTTTVDEVVFAIPLQLIEDVHQYIYFAEEMGITVRIIPDFQIERIHYLPSTARAELATFLQVPTLTLSSLPDRDVELFFKAVMDYTGAALGLVITAPFCAIISLLIKMSSSGPMLFSQERVGLNGRIFRMYKFRTMVENAEELKAELAERNEVDGPVFKIEDDPRITGVGRFLRRSSLDELPQLLNVIRGEMSLVGPRPPVPEEVKNYEIWQRRRLSMKPGLTCIWQVSGRNRVGFERWMAMDLEYIDTWSLWLDVKILVKTVVEVLRGGGR